MLCFMKLKRLRNSVWLCRFGACFFCLRNCVTSKDRAKKSVMFLKQFVDYFC